jgi:hypothetical protein
MSTEAVSNSLELKAFMKSNIYADRLLLSWTEWERLERVGLREKIK